MVLAETGTAANSLTPKVFQGNRQTGMPSMGKWLVVVRDLDVAGAVRLVDFFFKV